jgi:acyl-CoA thioesterase I
VKQIILSMALIWFIGGNVFGGEKLMFIEKLQNGVKQHLVTYGTSLTECGEWVNQLRNFFNQKYPGLVTVTNSGASGMWSGWGVDNLEERILKKNPDVVFIEFAINDAYLPYKTTVPMCRKNLETMIDRILKQYPKCQIILMTMNPPIREHLEIRPKVEEYYQAYREVAKERKLLLIDHYPVWKAILDKDPKTYDAYVSDGIHPNGLGSEKVTTPNILAILYGPLKKISPDDPNIRYQGVVAMEKSSSRAAFDRLLKGYPFNLGSTGTKIIFKTDALIATLEMEYTDKATFTDSRVLNGNGVCLVDKKITIPFTRTSDKGGVQSVDVSPHVPAGVHTYEIILPICDKVDFLGIRVNKEAKVLTPEPAPKTRYVAYGDSITQGFYATDAVHTYPFLLAESKQWELVNFGFGSRTAVPSDGAIIPRLKPDIITILLGVNDCLGKATLADFRSNYSGVLDNIRKEMPKVPVYLITPLNLPGKWPGSEPLDGFRQVIRSLVKDRKDSNLHLVEGPDLIPDSGKYFQDGLHPNDEGFARMAKELGAKIRP